MLGLLDPIGRLLGRFTTTILNTHYTGVITLEPVPEKIGLKWTNDQWLIDLDYKPFYVVDGQQRHYMVLIQAIIESIQDGRLIASQSVDKIKQKLFY